ncbi:RnfABCDGE type electron transport complex subunit G [Candidatus Methanoliparum sp. LAM-1]|uniref:RnfABCDGE type electron transport complex subunit G n=1 Tax=Candidatus Methanoliparum sp. LAM-1 TaxID=2874846 RepID=UPI001E3AE359|nr:RnfABCDGE type electron transport complex subunit G [Candidatus Methanoliparum sp. LAM-1]BDC36492.1 electron transport complex subunit G [Candidatus Methanoliparum sp. LAM-1]
MKENIKRVVVLTIIILASSLSIYVYNNTVEDVLKEQEMAELTEHINMIFPDAERFIQKDDIYYVYSDDEIIGYAFEAIGKGYGGDITILVGINNDEDLTIKKVSVLSHSETPGLGARITEDEFVSQFDNKPIDAIKLEGIDAITGATISSKAVVNAVYSEYKNKIQSIRSE